MICRILFPLLALTFLTLPVRADWLQLSNGDTFQGELMEMSLKEVKLKHEILGEITIPRDRVHAIVLGDFQAGKRVMADGTEAEPETPEEVIDRLVNPDFDSKAVQKLEQGAKRQKTPYDAVEQLRREGIDTKLTDSLHLMLPGFGSPKVQEHFHSRVDGLMNGSISINDIRNEAIDARDQLQVLMDELGPSGAALQGYFGILDNFIQKTDPKIIGPPPEAPTPTTP